MKIIAAEPRGENEGCRKGVIKREKNMENTIKLEADPRIIELLEQINKKLDRLIGDEAEKIYSLKEAALRIGIAYNTALAYTQSGQLRYIDRGAGKQKISYGIPESAIEEFKMVRMRGEAI